MPHVHVTPQQVRHPLRVISTLVTRAAKWDRIWLWLSYMDGCQYINKHQAPLVGDEQQ